MTSGDARVAVGLVGLGTIAETHLAVLSMDPRVRVAFVADPDPRAEVTFKGSLPPRYERLGDALGHHQPDLVVIATPTDTHAGLAREAVTGSTARVLVEKPLVHDLAALDELRSLEPAGVASRVFVAHHFAFSPEVRWAADVIAAHPRWGPVTRIVAVFHDPYIGDADHSFAAYRSSWIDSGVNQLSMLSRFVELTGRSPLHETNNGASAWCTATFLSGDTTTGVALLRTSWEAVASSKRTTLYLDDTNTEIWLDHTAVTAVAIHDRTLVDHLPNNGHTPRKIAHYQPLYDSLLSATPDPVLSINTAARVLDLLYR